MKRNIPMSELNALFDGLDTGFSKREFVIADHERIEPSKCEHEYLVRLNSTGWAPIEECRKCHDVKRIPITFSAPERK